MHEPRILAALLATLAAAPADTTPPTTPATGPTVTIGVFQFQPDSLSVAAGTEVTWLNHDETVHTVRADDPRMPGGWTEATLDGRGSSQRLVFERPGTFSYHCGRHPDMRGVVHVTRSTEEAS